jgi:hypothetical protein
MISMCRLFPGRTSARYRAGSGLPFEIGEGAGTVTIVAPCSAPTGTAPRGAYFNTWNRLL